MEYEDIIEEKLDDFAPQIASRGQDYYENGNVISIYKNNNMFIAKVIGNREEPYNVKITFDKVNEDAELECDCPCDFYCKHEYAVLLGIENSEYKEMNILPTIFEDEGNLKDIIEKIPPEELKEYILSHTGKYHIIDSLNEFKKYFKSYAPLHSYDYYYNNLYNDLLLEDANYSKLVNNYLDSVKEYISQNNFEEVLKIIYAIINAYNDSNKLNANEFIVDKFPSISMYLRITYRKCNEDLKNEIEKWIEMLKQDNYYNSYYLEDAILSLK